jgi:hypothetical protein
MDSQKPKTPSTPHSIFSLISFLAIGGLCNYGIELSLGSSWAISMGILACMGCGVYELGRRDGQS